MFNILKTTSKRINQMKILKQRYKSLYWN